MLNGNAIRQRIPHRYPMLMLDRVTELQEGYAKGYKNVTFNEPFFRGHFPEAPVLPGVLALESILQLTWLMLDNRGDFRLQGIKRLKFRRPIIPGDRLELEVKLTSSEGNQREITATGTVNGHLAVQGKIYFTLSRHPETDSSDK